MKKIDVLKKKMNKLEIEYDKINPKAVIKRLRIVNEALKLYEIMETLKNGKSLI